MDINYAKQLTDTAFAEIGIVRQPQAVFDYLEGFCKCLDCAGDYLAINLAANVRRRVDDLKNKDAQQCAVAYGRNAA